MLVEREEQKLREKLEAELRRQISVGIIVEGRVDEVEMTGPTTFRIKESIKLQPTAETRHCTLQIGPDPQERLP